MCFFNKVNQRAGSACKRNVFRFIRVLCQAVVYVSHAGRCGFPLRYTQLHRQLAKLAFIFGFSVAPTLYGRCDEVDSTSNSSAAQANLPNHSFDLGIDDITLLVFSTCAVIWMVVSFINLFAVLYECYYERRVKKQNARDDRVRDATITPTKPA